MSSETEDEDRWSKFNKKHQLNKQPRPFTALATIAIATSEASFDSKIVNENVSRSASVHFKTKPKRIRNYGSTFESRSKSTINFYSRPFSTYSVIGKGLRPKSKDETSIDQDKPKRSFWQLMRLTMLMFGNEVLFSLEVALTVPIMLKLKVPEEVYSLVYFFSPLIGFLLQPVLGLMSDRCQSKLGRRRPFILALAIGSFLGISLILNGYLIGQKLGDDKSDVPKIAIFLTGLGVTLLDFSADSSDTPLRAYVMDVCNTQDQDTGFNLHAFLGGMGSALGFVISAIEWDKTFLGFIGDQMQILYVFATILFVFSLVSSLTSVKETPLVLPPEELPLLKPNSITNLPDELIQETRNESETNLDNGVESEVKNDDDDDEEDDDEDKPISLKLFFKSVLKMPKELLRLLICQTFGWLAFFSTTLFFTDFVGQSIYHGDPLAERNSTSFAQYNEGVKMGCWCLLTYSLMSAVSAVVLEKFLMTRVSTRSLYFFSYLINGISCAAIYFQSSIYAILPLSSTFGIILTAITTLPYQMVSEFHKDKSYKKKSPPGTQRGFGVDCSLVGSIFFLGQTVISSFMSLLVSKFGNYTTVLLGAIFSLLGCLWISLFVIFPKPRDKKKPNNTH